MGKQCGVMTVKEHVCVWAVERLVGVGKQCPAISVLKAVRGGGLERAVWSVPPEQTQNKILKEYHEFSYAIKGQ